MPTAPSAPALTSATGGDQSIILVWTAPTSTGGSPITDYQYTTDGTTYKSLGTTGTTATITTPPTSTDRLVNGTSYTLYIRAVNSIGFSTLSNSKSAIPVLPSSTMTLTITVSTADRAAMPIRLGLGFLAGQSVRITWGDGTNPDTWTATPQHTYGATGQYTLTIVGTANLFGNNTSGGTWSGIYNSTNATVALVSVGSWLESLTILKFAFLHQPNNFTVPASLPTNATDISDMFSSAVNFNQRNVSYWVTTKITNMSGLFARAAAFNQPLDRWDTENVTNMSGMFLLATAFNQPLQTWSTGNVTLMTNMFNGATAFNNDLSSWDISKLTNAQNIFANGTLIGSTTEAWPDFTTNTKIPSPPINPRYYGVSTYAFPSNTMVVLITVSPTDLVRPVNVELTFSGDQTVDISWGDNTTDTWSLATPPPNHTYAVAGSYTVTIVGTADGFSGVTTIPGQLGLRIESVKSWLASLTNLSFAFAGQPGNFTVPDYLPPNVTATAGMFYDAIAFNQPLATWTTDNITNMSDMFTNATAFNQPLVAWNTGNVIDMHNMFQNAASFNQSLATWDTSNVTTMVSMFENARAFNGSVASWNTFQVTTMANMFKGATSFNQPLTPNFTTNFWNTENVTDMTAMFAYASLFNQPLATWRMANVTSISTMFGLAPSFNQPLAGWNLGNVTNASQVFFNASSFNQDISSWDMSKCTNMLYMFYGATKFNKPLNSWDVSKVIEMAQMFQNATSFNQPLNSWNTERVANMRQMFQNTAAFYADLSSWNISSVGTAERMFTDSKYMAANKAYWPNFLTRSPPLPNPNTNPAYYTK